MPLGEGVPPVHVKFGPKTQAIRFSLRTSDPSEVKMRQAAAAGFFEEVFASLRQERALSLSRSQVAALAGDLYRSWASEQPTSRKIAFEEIDGRMVRTYHFDGLDDEADIAALADLLVATVMGEWDHTDTIEIRVALDSWLPTKRTRVTGEKNTARRLAIADGQLEPVRQPAAEM